MKILLATYFVVPHTGGVWNYMVQLRKELESLGHEVDLLGQEHNFIYIVNKNRRVEKEKLIPLVNERLSKHKDPSIFSDSFIKRYEFLRHLYEIGVNQIGLQHYDLIHTQDVISTAAINKIRPLGTPLVASLHGSVAHELKHFHIKKSPTSHLAWKYFDNLEFEGATAAECTIVANSWLKKKLNNEYKVPNEQIKVLHYGYDTITFLKRTKAVSPIKPPVNKKVIIYSGRLVELKGIQYLLSSLHQLKSLRNDWICWIVGDGYMMESLKLKTNELGLEKEVIFWGNRDDVPYLLTLSDIFILPSIFENQPLSVIEAQIAGKAAIVSDAGGLPDMVKHGVTGLITKAGDSNKLCTNINYLLEHDEFRKKLGSNAQQWGLSHWSQEKAIKNLLDVYQSSISKKTNKK
ncbi:MULTISPECIES: glycosyltransferase family 4 protein [Bacillus]|uniref:Glycosyl transferase n=2 Tax=Bacillus TaxID=1386 RepID=A0A0M4G9P4_9BACI|nr:MULTISPECIES: glycosyltransferase family 4 protein [Bacillus]ALC82140.1 glycosyl transferase [Bacillus gobiensis]MBP1080955.1 glycosyltransferase involved in cell wall biosynthesis [Bacillus capparidis]MED1095658.1 glycosyltransferase family 4 protein [Bacillus capparidis]